jgi:hypothetical protein
MLSNAGLARRLCLRNTGLLQFTWLFHVDESKGTCGWVKGIIHSRNVINSMFNPTVKSVLKKRVNHLRNQHSLALVEV